MLPDPTTKHSMPTGPWIIYGANGYTGRLVVAEAQRQGLQPVLAGRNREQILQLGRETGLETRVFGLEAPEQVDEGLRGMRAVLHCAGPFVHTYRPMVEACLRLGVDYLDITGELAVLEGLHALDAKAREAGILLMPGTGFDVVPTDCMVWKLARELPGSDQLLLAFVNRGSRVSHGTLRSMLTRLGEPGAERVNGQLLPKPIGRLGANIDFGIVQRFCVSIPWGDLFTAWTGTGIPNIVTMTAARPLMHRLLRFQALYNPLLQTAAFRRLLVHWVDRNVWGPNADELGQGQALVYGKITHPDGRVREARLALPESYRLTAMTSVGLVQQLGSLREQGRKGWLTPAAAMGPDWVVSLEGCRWLEPA
jgi:short subunit dehydrogenase-like uncharacterized protein